MDEYTQQPTRRRRQPPIPKWQRILRKYWPTIRFGMICFIVLAIIILLIDGIVGLFTKDKEDATTAAFYSSQAESCASMESGILVESNFCI